MKFRFDNLDSIRTIAFLSTFLAHAFYSESTDVLESSTFQWAVYFREIFSFGVPIFFVLSGFLITYLMFREQEKTGKFSVRNFYVRRVLRIWPVYYLVILIGFVVFPLLRSYVLNEPMSEPASPLMYSLFLSNFNQINTTALPYGVGLGPTWSVSVEEQFYLIWPLFLVLMPRKKFIGAIGFVMLASLLLTYIFGLSSKHTIYCMLYLSVGSLFGYLAYYHEQLVLRITNVHPSVFLLSAIALIVTIFLNVFYFHSFWMILLISVLIGYVIIYQCYGERMQLKRIPFFERLGKYTYGLYLYHVICNFVIFSLFSKIFHIEETVMNVVFLRPILSLLLSVVVSYFSYKYMETYFLRWKEKFSRT